MTKIPPPNGWLAIQMWAKAIAPCDATQIQGFPITARYLADLMAHAGAEARLTETVRSGSPAEVSLHLLSLRETETSERLGGLVNDRLRHSLADEAMRLDRICRGSEESPLGRLIPHRRKIINDLASEIYHALPASSEAERQVRAEFRATLAANEAIPYAARYLTSREDDSRKANLIRQELSASVASERVSDVLFAFEAYLRAVE